MFGCIAYAHIPTVKRMKLDSKSEKCIFLGYSDRTQGYKLFNPVTGEVIVSRDIEFMEDEAWSRTTEEKLQQGTSINEESDVENTRANSSPPTFSLDQVAETNSSPPPPPVAVHRTSTRTRVLPARFHDYVVTNDADDELSHEELVNFALFADCDPITFAEASQDNGWLQAMNDEIQAIEKNDTWELTTLPVGNKSIGVKRVYKTKFKPDGNIDRLKARLVVKGYKQKPGINYYEVFAPVARMDTIRMVTALASLNKW